MNRPKSNRGFFESGCFVPVVFVSIVIVLLLILVLGIGQTSLSNAAGKGDLEEVKRLVESGASIDKRNFYGRTPLEEALRNATQNGDDFYKVAEYLLSKGAKFDSSMFVSPILDGNYDFIKELVDKGYSLEPDSLAIYVCFNSEFSNKTWNEELADLMIENGAEINFNYYDEVYKETYTPLGFAVHYRDMRIVQYLVERGANVNMPMENGKTPLELANEEYKVNIDDPTGPGVHYYKVIPPSYEIANYLRSHGAL